MALFHSVVLIALLSFCVFEIMSERHMAQFEIRYETPFAIQTSFNCGLDSTMEWMSFVNEFSLKLRFVGTIDKGLCPFHYTHWCTFLLLPTTSGFHIKRDREHLSFIDTDNAKNVYGSPNQ